MFLDNYKTLLEASPSRNRNMKSVSISTKNSKMKKIYVVLTYTNTTFAKVTKFLLDQPYTHCSLSLDKSLKDLYSFNFALNGFVREDLTKDTVLQNSKYSIYSLTVTEEQYLAIAEKLEYMVNNKDNYSYNVGGLLRIFLKKPKETEEKATCSQFTAKILEIADSNLFNKHNSLVVPYDFAKNKKFKFECKGILKNYNPDKIKEV